MLIEWVLTCAGSGVNKVTDDVGADINSMLTLCSCFVILTGSVGRGLSAK